MAAKPPAEGAPKGGAVPPQHECRVPELAADAEVFWLAAEHFRAAAADQPRDLARDLAGSAERLGWQLAAHPAASDRAQAAIVDKLTRAMTGLTSLAGGELAQVIADGLEAGADNYRLGVARGQ
jgi:Ca2+-binding RTX toxin-like protein